ncbi:autotransporter-associated beta strand repeat-containing protein [Collimonas sp.]|jgi:autotransporter-associated beta strand protein|uniref:autotransporter-associated beta strand repeat-containing protein n=1 Tax=Collimonas sp. TaxID=1963772 RepID=UPI002C874076|nr:autotransporter-associated beta strand repeat-containing protein [Collimonas sp.]HWW04723.1 autotransporter-associated beta strand repeat-containing protein [Collimonas sp.]
MKIKTYVPSAIAAALISTLSACGGGDSASSGDTANATNPATPATTTGTVTNSTSNTSSGSTATNTTSTSATTAVTGSTTTQVTAVALIDISAAILANQNLVLNGDSVVNLPAGTTTYSGVISGAGTLTLRAPSGAGTLVLTADSNFTLPASQQTETATQTKSPFDPNHVHYWVIHNPNPPAVIVDAGATLQLGTPSSTGGSIGSYIPNTAGTTINLDNYQIDGTLVLESGPPLNMGILSGSGVIRRPPIGATGGTVRFVGDNPFSGVYSQLYGGYFGVDHVIFSMPNATIFSNESFITAAPEGLFGDTAGHLLKYPKTIWESHYGDDINTNSGLVIFSGVYSYSNSGDQLKPALSNPSLNTMLVQNVSGSLTGGHNSSFRGINIEGGITQWGDGTSNQFFLPSAPSPAAPDSSVKNAYINLHRGSTLVFDYNGKYSCNVGITGGGGGPHADGSTGAGNLTIAATAGNYAILTMPQNYNGITTIGAGATLQIGNGAPVSAVLATVGAPTAAEPYGAVTRQTTLATYTGDSSLLTAESASGSLSDAIVDNGTLIIANTSSAITLANISGSGTLKQAGAANTTLSGANSYSGGTTISGGTLSVASATALGSGSLTNGATLATAGSQHAINVSGSYTQTASGNLVLSMGSVNDQLKVGGQAFLSGSLTLNFASTPAPGSRFVVVQAAGGVSGGFSSISGNGVTLAGGQDAGSYYVTVQ